MEHRLLCVYLQINQVALAKSQAIEIAVEFLIVISVRHLPDP